MPDPTHLLVVDDDTGVLDLLRRYFVGQGFEVSTAAGGAEMRSVLKTVLATMPEVRRRVSIDVDPLNVL